MKNKQLWSTQIQFLALWPCLPLIANQMAILRIHLRIMDLEEEGAKTALIEEEVELDLTLMEVSSSYLRQ